MGSGAVGVEFASIFRRFGSEVTIIELLPRLVPVEDEAVSAELERSFKKQGIKVLTGTKVTTREGQAPTASTIEAQTPDGKTADAQRRVPARRDRPRPGDHGLGAEEAGPRASSAATSRSTSCIRTSVPGISAIGDVITFEQAGPPAARAPVVGRRHRRSPSGSPARRSGRSTTTTCPAAPTAIRRSAASG